jgi:hypothetical protein
MTLAHGELLRDGFVITVAVKIAVLRERCLFRRHQAGCPTPARKRASRSDSQWLASAPFKKTPQPAALQRRADWHRITSL